MRSVTRGRGRGALGAAALVALVALQASSAPAADERATALGDTRAMLEKWRETRRLIAKEKHDWAVAKELLGDRIDLVGAEIERLRERLAETEGSVGEADRKGAELEAEDERLAAAATALRDTAGELEARTRALLPRLPEPLRERVRPLSQRLPAAGAEPTASLSQRFQNVVGVLDAANDFHRDVTAASEVRTLADGTRAEVTTVYAGVSLAWYATADGTRAGTGRPGPDGWTWTPASDAAAEIAAGIEILGGGVEARFVQVPVRVDGDAAAPSAPVKKPVEKTNESAPAPATDETEDGR